MLQIKNFMRNIKYLMKYSLKDRREEDIVYLTNKILDDGIYEYGLEFQDYWKITVMSQDETLDLIERYPKSFIRTGDGEIRMMMGMDQAFQKYEKEIADSLLHSLNTKREDMYVGLNRNYFIPLISSNNPVYYRRNAYDYREFYKKHLNKNIQYIDSTFTSYPLGRERCQKYDTVFARWKKLFSGKHIVIVCGKGILDSYQYDIFELASKKTIIDAPRRNAWDKKDEILSAVRKFDRKECVVVFILGMAGKALIPILTEDGYMCWDVGHLAKYYNAYMSGTGGSDSEIRKFYAPD